MRKVYLILNPYRNLTIISFIAAFILSAGNLFSQWQPDVRLTNNPDTSFTFANNIASSDQVVHVVWYEKEVSGLRSEEHTSELQSR